MGNWPSLEQQRLGKTRAEVTRSMQRHRTPIESMHAIRLRSLTGPSLVRLLPRRRAYRSGRANPPCARRPAREHCATSAEDRGIVGGERLSIPTEDIPAAVTSVLRELESERAVATRDEQSNGNPLLQAPEKGKFCRFFQTSV